MCLYPVHTVLCCACALQQAGLIPMMEQIEHFAQTHPGMSLAALIVRQSRGVC